MRHGHQRREMATKPSHGWFVVGSLLLASCGLERSRPPAHEATPTGGVIAGTVVDSQGAALGGIGVAACNDAVCIPTTSGEDGGYHLEVSELGPYKMELFGEGVGLMSMYYYQEATPAGAAPPPANVTAMAAPDDKISWPISAGGRVTLAAGALTLEAAADDLLYPIGAEEEVWGAAVDVDHLPVYDRAPWAAGDQGVLAFHLNPGGTKCREGTFAFEVRGEGATEGRRYEAWSVDPSYGILEAVGAAVADEAGAIRGVEGARLRALSTLILVPEGT